MSVLDLRQLKYERTQLRRKLTENLNKLDGLFKEENALDEIKQEYLTAEDKANRLFKIDEKVSELLLSEVTEENEQDYAKEYDTMESYRDRWTKTVAKKLDLFDRIKGSNTDRPNGSIHAVESEGLPLSCHLRNYRLPKLEITKFDGSIKNWICFWAQFRKIHEDTNLDDEEKFQYLFQSTLDESPARYLIDSFPPSAKNYNKAVEQLKRRFGRDELLIELYVRELLNLVLIQVTVGKNQMSLRSLYDKLETQLRCLESLGVTSDKYACMLYPLVESSLPDPILKEWERRRPIHNELSQDDSEDQTRETTHLRELMVFLRKEVESEERLALVRESFTSAGRMVCSKEIHQKQSGKKVSSDNYKNDKKFTATDLVNTKSSNPNCVFCEGLHHSEMCFKARNMSAEELQKHLKKKACCFLCLKRGHTVKMCKLPQNVTCFKCGKRHFTLLCESTLENTTLKKEENIDQNLSNTNYNQVLLQTLQVNLVGSTNKTARLLIDTGSQRSYVTKSLIRSMRYKPIGEEELRHALFGGVKTEVKYHNRYKISLKSLTRDYRCNFDVLDSDTICSHVPVANEGPWSNELKDLNIKMSDVKEGPIDILVGADIAGKLLTGQTKVLNCGLVAVETLLGWTVMGRVKDDTTNFMTLDVNMLCTDISATNLWKLDVLGIEDPVEVKSRHQSTFEAEVHFKETVNILDNGRYEVQLPWLDGHPPLPRNFDMAQKRLEVTCKKLISSGLLNAYSDVFSGWLADDIIERVTSENWDVGHYLPHRPVIKENSTTKIRPVFDASAAVKGSPSLNQCLEKGTNLIELIPDVLLRFRLDCIGVISDIRKAFLQISLCNEDRDFLRFLWYDEDGKMIIYRHKRVVFGVSSSPFLLAAVLKHHLDRVEQLVDSGSLNHSTSTVQKLRESFYVDNCVTSVSSSKDLQHFMLDAKSILEHAQFDLRGWEFSDPNLSSSTCTPVLGLLWDKKFDVLKVNVPEWNFESNLTKRTLLSATQKVFDVIGVLCPTTIVLRILIQQAWKLGGGWDTKVDENIYTKFFLWIKEASILKEIQIPRYIQFTLEKANISLHTFCDASQVAYAAVCYLRVEQFGNVTIHFIEAKSRVAPLKQTTIPRLELLAATIGARLARSVLKVIKIDSVFFWTDSMTVLSWIKQEEPWGVFVWNRVQEIRQLTDKKSWHHIPGTSNPADLASRGCSPSTLVKSKWWEGPDWLKESDNEWPSIDAETNEHEIRKELKKKVVTNILISDDKKVMNVLCQRFSKYSMMIKVVGWIQRFYQNCKNKVDRMYGDLSVNEINQAEVALLKLVQQESFESLEDKRLIKLKPFFDCNGLIRLKTKILNREDTEQFRLPIVLPSNHIVVERLIHEKHLKYMHMISQGLLNILRENYWIIKGRQAVKRVTRSCVVCQRYAAKPFEVETPPLPENRVRNATVFEVSGTDFCGPLYVNGTEKIWVCVFTCAVYRAVHLDIVSSLSTEEFTMAFRRFVARRGRPSIMYSDNGTNFKGIYNALKKVNWNKIRKMSSAERIEWRFNPPTGAWWGGFWERLIGILKNILRKVLGNTSLTREELYTVICECESIINSRPITYVSEDVHDPVPITPMMFLQETKQSGVPDCDEIDFSSMNRRLKYRLRLKEEIRKRFRSEYLGQLIQFKNKKKENRMPIEGEVVLIQDDNKKRLHWPIARIEKVIFGKDGKCRVVYLKTSRGRLCRPVQRIFPLEIVTNNNVESEESKRVNLSNLQQDNAKKQPKQTFTKCGRQITRPKKLVED